MEVGEGAIVGEGAEIGDNVTIGAYTRIGDDAIIGDDVVVGDFCVIGHPTKKDVTGDDFSLNRPETEEFIRDDPSVRIGSNSVIRSHSVIYTHVDIGESFNTGHYAFVREHTTIGENCVVGTGGKLSGYNRVGDRSKVQTSAFLCQTTELGRGVFVAPYTSFYDNKRVIPGEGGLKGPKVGDYVRIGGESKILPGVSLGKGSLMGTGSVVTKDVGKFSVVMGNPAEETGRVSREEFEEFRRSIEGWG